MQGRIMINPVTARFEIVEGCENLVENIPMRATPGSAGYDLKVIEGDTIAPHESKVFRTGVRCRFDNRYVLALSIRSSYGIKKHITLANQIGIIDSDYCDNEDTHGEIFLALRNDNPQPVEIKAGERVAQAILLPFLIVSNDQVASDNRTGGIGSTGE